MDMGPVDVRPGHCLASFKTGETTEMTRNMSHWWGLGLFPWSTNYQLYCGPPVTSDKLVYKRH
jgi:hypothetical protein